MTAIPIQNQPLATAAPSGSSPVQEGQELEQVLGAAVLNDLNSQLTDISKEMERQVEEKQGLRGEIEAIYRLKQDIPIQRIEGQDWRDLNSDEAHFLEVTDLATPQTDESGEIMGYRIKEEDFQEASDAEIKNRENRLEDINSNSELTMLKIQALVDQRKNALSLLSNLLAASNSVAQTIINNIKN